ncbi:unnamed protein product [Symbiodinium necroappetens]|uniref:Uncharacterized protein n=1 Tax=Symbiodinium necroappetens TaxID=1628268 RepID=A0A812YUA3_9DINO|nr:unnamed protein product [Symbiodinium necroappetens]
MLYQATAEEEQHPGTLEIFKQTMSNEYVASQEVLKFAEENPPDQMYKKKKFIDWAAFRTIHGKTISNTERNKTKPMWRGQFLLWAKNIMALDDEEATEWWNELEQDPKIAKDHNGYKGRKQLYIPNFITKLTDRTSFITHQQEQGNKPIQKPNEEKIEMLRAHVKRQRQDINNEFLQVSRASSAAAEDGDGSGGQRPHKRQKIDLDRELPKFSRAMDKDLSGLKKSFSAVVAKVDSVFEAIKKVDLKLFLTDTAFFGLLRSLELRLHFMYRWNGTVPTPQSVHEELKKLYDAAVASGSGGDIKVDTALLEKGLLEFGEHAAKSDEDIVKACKDRLPLKEPHLVGSEASLLENIQKALSLQTVDDFEKFEVEWTAACSNASSLANSLRKVAGDVCDHIKTKAREAERAEVRRQNAEKQEALKKVRDDAKNAAAEIRKKSCGLGPQMPAVLSADFSMVPAVPEIKNIADVQKLQRDDWSKPWVLKKTDEVQLCLGDSQLQKSFTTFALQCKKAKEQQGGRHQYNLAAGQVKDTVDAVMAKIMPKSDAILDMSNLIENGDKFTQSTWLYAYATDMSFVGLPPNGCAQVRVQATGSVECVIVDLKSFIAGTTEDNKLALTALHKELGKATELQPFLDKNIGVWKHTLTTGEALYLPTGVAVIEKCPPNQAFIYGMRKSFLCKPDASNYEAVLNLFTEDGRNIDRMTKIHEALKSFSADKTGAEPAAAAPATAAVAKPPAGSGDPGSVSPLEKAAADFRGAAAAASLSPAKS